MALLDDILAAQNNARSNPYATANASGAVNAINSRYAEGLLSGLAQLYTKYKSATDTLNTQMDQAKKEGQDTLNQNAVDALGAQRNIRELMGNYGLLDSGQAAAMRTQQAAAAQRGDDKIYTQRKTDEGAVSDKLTQLGNEGETDLSSLISDMQKQRDEAVTAQQQAEEKEREMEAKLEAQIAAASRASASRAGSSVYSSPGGGSASQSGNFSTSYTPSDAEYAKAKSGLINTYIPNGRLPSNQYYQVLYNTIKNLPYDETTKYRLMSDIPAVDPVTHALTSFGKAYEKFMEPNSVSQYKPRK